MLLQEISLESKCMERSSSVAVLCDVHIMQLLLKGKLGRRPVWEHTKFIEYWREKAERHTWVPEGSEAI